METEYDTLKSRSLTRNNREVSTLRQSGQLLLIDGIWYVTHSGLLDIATAKGATVSMSIPYVPFASLHFTVGFQGYGIQVKRLPRLCRFRRCGRSNVSLAIRGAEMRIAETRAVNRALRKAYGIGLCSIEEIGSTSGPSGPSAQQQKQPARATSVLANGNGHHLRDRLLVLIRQQKLDGALVKAYAADFCDVKELRDASKEQIQQFIDHLSEYAADDRDGLLCQLNSYGPKQESAA